MTNTRMWTKSIELGNTSVPFQGTSVYSGALTSNLNIRRDVGLLIALTPKIEEIYRIVLTTADNYLDPSKVRLVSAQAAEVRKRGAISVPRSYPAAAPRS